MKTKLLVVAGLAIALVATHAQTQTPPAQPPGPPTPAPLTVGTRYIGGTVGGPPIVESYAAFEGKTKVVPVVAPPSELGLDPYYKKYVNADGIPVVSSELVRDDALLLARDIVNYMLSKRADIRAVMVG